MSYPIDQEPSDYDELWRAVHDGDQAVIESSLCAYTDELCTDPGPGILAPGHLVVDDEDVDVAFFEDVECHVRVESRFGLSSAILGALYAGYEMSFETDPSDPGLDPYVDCEVLVRTFVEVWPDEAEGSVKAVVVPADSGFR